MSNHTVDSYDLAINAIYRYLDNMGMLISELLEFTQKALMTRDLYYAEMASEEDQKINDLDLKVEQAATNLLALRQPVGIDLRVAISAFKMAVIMERMGDLNKNTAKRLCLLEKYPGERTKNKLLKMIGILINSQKDAITAFRSNNHHLALEVVRRDEEVDMLYYEILSNTQACMINEPQNIPSYLQIMFAIKNLERIGDYIAKIAYMVHYILTGEITMSKTDHSDLFSHIDFTENS